MVKKTKSGKNAGPSQQTTTFQYAAVLVFLTVVNVMFFFSHGFSESSAPCTTDILFDTLIGYINGIGRPRVETVLPQQCLKPSASIVRTLEDAVRNMVTECNQSPSDKKPRVIVTLVTTFADHIHSDSEKLFVHNNTLLNWAKLKPRVNLVLFSNDSFWTKVARSHGWTVLPPKNSSVKSRPPILKDMFAAAKDRFDTLWYGYVNADILFTSDLIDHLDFLTHRYNATHKSILLTGRRTNVQNVSFIDPLSDDSLKSIAESQGELYKEDAEDFFISTRLFPWSKILPVVVGRPAYDNWLVAEARCRLQAEVIDVTETLLALHQTTVKGGNLEGHTHNESDINFKIFSQNKLKPNFLSGLTTCVEFNTFYTLCDTLGIYRRPYRGDGCKCKK